MTEPDPLTPPEGYAYAICPTCNRVMTVLSDGAVEFPWCIHHSSEYSWRGPTSPETDWTKMVPAIVHRAPTAGAPGTVPVRYPRRA